MKPLSYYAEEISTATPGQLTELLIEMTHDYATVCDELIPIERAKMAFWLEHKKIDSAKPVSDKTLEMFWMAVVTEPNGVLQRRMELYKKALEKLMSNVKAILRQKENEAKNLM